MKRSLKKYPTGGEYKEMYPNIPGVYIKDSRKVRATTGKKIKPTRDLVSGYYRQDVIDSLARTAIERGINPYRAIAQGLAETNLGFTDENIGHVLYGKGENPYSDMMDAIKEGDALAAKRGKTKEEDIIQGYNRYGKLTPNTEKDYHKFKSKAFYGVPIPKEGLDMDKNPLYGKHILDLQKNVLEKSHEIRNIVQKYQYPRPKQSETEQMVGEKWKPTLYAKGGTFLTAGNEYHRIYKNADGDIMVNHPKEDKGKWDTINLTDKANAKTVADGVAATKKWHRENPYGYGGSIFNYPDGGRTPIVVNNPNDPRLKAYNDSLFAYNKYKDKDEWVGGKNVLKFKNKKEEQQYNDLHKKMESIQNMEYAEQDKLWSDPNFKKLNQDEQFKRLMGISNKYTNNKSYKDIVARVNYLNTENTSVEGARYVPKWYDNKNLTVRSLKPISWDKKEYQEVQGQYNTTTNQYGTIIDRNNPVSGNKTSSKTIVQYSPNFKEPVQPVVYQKPQPQPQTKTKITTNFEQRIQNPVKKIKNKDGSTSTHKMMSFEADGKFYAAPTIVEKNGKLVELSPKNAVDYALKNKEYKQFATEKESQEYAEGKYKVGTPLEEKITTDTIDVNQPMVYNKKDWSKYFGEPKPLTVKVGDGRTEIISNKDYYYIYRPTGKKYSPEEYEKIKNKEEGGLINNTMKKRTLSKTVYKYGGKLPQHGTGATVGSAVGGAAAMSLNLLVPGLGFAAAPVGTALGSMIGETFDDKGPSQEELQRQQETADRIKYGPKQENPYVDVTQKNFNFPYGGIIDQHMMNPNAELELEETFQTPDGTVGRVDGPSHDNGGIEVNLPEGTKIFSDRLKYKNGRTYAQITKPITTKIAKLEKKLQDNPQDVASANTVYLLNQQLDHYFDDQETNKSMKEIKRTLKMANGGMIKRADGSYSRRGLWDNIRANKGSGKKPTKEMLEQERKIKAQEKAMGGYMYAEGGINNPGFRALPEYVQEKIIANMEMGGYMYAHGGTIPVVDDAGSFNKDGVWVPDWKAIKEQAKKLGAKTVKTRSGGAVITFDKNWNIEGADDNPTMAMGGYMYPIGGKLMNDPMFAEGGKLPKEVLMPRLQAHMSPAEVEEYLDEYGSGGYTVRKTNERKGKTHVVIGPDGTKKYFGDPKMGEKGKSKYGKEAFYARHKKNLDKNPYFRAYARATWQEGGTIGEEGMNQEPLFEYKDGGIYIKPENRGKFTAYAKAHGKGVQEMASHIMANKEDYSPTLVKRANFARNAAKWKHEHGGLIHYPNGGPVLGQINPRTGKAFSRDEVSTYYDFADMLPTPFGMEYGGLDSQGNQRFGNYNQLSLPSPVNPQETISPRFPQRPQPGALAAPSPVNAELTVDPMAQLKNTIEFQAPGEINIDELDLSGLGKTTTPATRDFSNVDDTTLFGSPTFKPTPNLSGINVKDNPPGGPTTKPESWASRNMGTIGQVGAGLAGAALRAYNLSKVKAPEKLSNLDFSSSMYNPDLVDYSANINAANRSAISAMDEAQRGFGSSAAAQAFKNKARLNQLETTGKIYQGQENVNKQLLNEARQRNQQIRMQEQAANQDIARQNMENAYNYNVWKQQQKNQIIQDLIGTTGNVFGGMQKFRNDTEMANILAKARENEVNIDALPEEVQLSYFRSLSPDQQATFNQKRARLGRTTFEFGGMIREFKDGGIHIKPENRGKFTATKKRTGKSTEELTHSKNPLTRKRAIFAQNAKKWAKK